MYTLFVLGELLDNPLSGYQLRDILGYVIGTRVKVSWGNIYPLLDKLSTSGDITLTAVADENTHPQKLATITEQGIQHFRELMSAPIKPGKNEELEYVFKLDNLHHVSTDQAIGVLTNFIDYQKEIQAVAEHAITSINGNEHIQPTDQFTSSSLNRYRVGQAVAAIAWAQALQKELAAGVLTKLRSKESL
ncbi:hypothetical protein IV55_GL000653 [Furfurilactobacillus siliginis]|uniref:PadR family transcriptional regulator n=2 Tax=Furfurilactobacillus siliginis TaxID=348151 RepID=A0A0R2KWS7_9LACO|nr:hypothetical protein IV55_GL000653 [Furfurilactobacillus siliginis]GEK29591.1 PadR family transcriptional regulator [Furfurilactobacillus siliginis]